MKRPGCFSAQNKTQSPGVDDQGVIIDIDAESLLIVVTNNLSMTPRIELLTAPAKIGSIGFGSRIKMMTNSWILL